MVNKPLTRPAISWGGTWPGGGRLTSHDQINGILDRDPPRIFRDPRKWFPRDPDYSHTTPIRIPKVMGIVWVPLTMDL